MPAAVEVIGDFAYCLMQLSESLSVLMIETAACALTCIAGHKSIHPAQKPELTFDTGFTPFHVLLWRCGEERVQSARIRTVFLDHLIGIRDIALRFGHRAAAH